MLEGVHVCRHRECFGVLARGCRKVQCLRLHSMQATGRVSVAYLPKSVSGEVISWIGMEQQERETESGICALPGRCQQLEDE